MSVQQTCAAAQRASRVLAGLPRARKDEALRNVADALARRAAEILAENAEDVRLARENRLPTRSSIACSSTRTGCTTWPRACAPWRRCPTRSGSWCDGWRLENGVELRKVRVPLGVVAVIYEARPNVTVDAACLCLKTGNAVILRGGSAAMHSNRILSEVVQGAVIEAGLPREAVSYLTPDRRELDELLEQRRYVDLVIPRGGEDLKRLPDGAEQGAGDLRGRRQLPRLRRRRGRPRQGRRRSSSTPSASAPACATPPRRCWSTAMWPPEFLPRAVDELKRRGVELVVDKAAADLLGDPTLKRANKTHYETEFLALKLAVRVVDSLDEALEHIATYGTRHSEAIVTEDLGAARRFTAEVDAACVYVNASTRFTDGGEFGLGAEMGISTQKLHARGPIALQELTCVKYELWGDGQVRP